MNCGEFKVRVSHGSRANPSTQHPNKNGCANSANLFGYVLFTAWIMPLIHSLCVSYWNSSLPCRLSTVVSLSHHTLSCGGSVISLQYREKLAEGRGYQIYTWQLGKRELDSDWEWSRWHLSTGFKSHWLYLFPAPVSHRLLSPSLESSNRWLIISLSFPHFSRILQSTSHHVLRRNEQRRKQQQPVMFSQSLHGWLKCKIFKT